MNKNEILVTYGTDYLNLTKDLLEKAGLAEQIKDKKKSIGIKPNLVSPVPPSEGATTHTEVLEGLIQYLQERGFDNLTMMEGSWVGARTADAIRVCGYDKLCRKYDVKLIDTQKEKTHKVNAAGLELSIVDCASEVDFMINVPVMKGHCQTHITCALKNMKGLLPNSEKRHFHAMGLHKPIAHLGTVIHQDFILVDSICGDLSFEDGGNPTQMDRIFCAKDPVLCDAYVCRMLDYELDEVPYIKMAEKLGVGCADLSKAVIREWNVPGKPEKLLDTRRAMKLAEKTEEVESCSACYGYLLPALDMLDKDGLLEELSEKVCIGQGFRDQVGELGVGNCTKRFRYSLKGCPPTENEMYAFLKKYIESHRK